MVARGLSMTSSRSITCRFAFPNATISWPTYVFRWRQRLPKSAARMPQRLSRASKRGRRRAIANSERTMSLQLETQYDAQFFDAIEHGSLDSARAIVPLVRDIVPFRSVVDVG